jgi:uncharacterized protein YoxC
LIGNRDIEDSLDRLDKLTQEEARMASAELLNMTRIVDGKVMDVDDRVKGVEGKVQDVRGDVQDVCGDVQDVRSDVQDVGNNVKGVDDRVQAISSDVKHISSDVREASRTFSKTPVHCSEHSDIFTGIQLRDGLLRWLSPPDPSINHNIASKAHHNGTSQWFFEGSIFEQWKSTDPFLWIHGKRALLLTFTMRRS